ncbi:TPA: type-F conjugative transfer system pilin assembly protein TrbC [Legionella pneumophila]|nr:type-F conjugative transfer system pilin assembly protein TrbC [Legionella pneumophila]HAU0349936.1 type-F conjugative transfer system pilin assembly protein TrbC [Legionella pneumophila]HAU0353427.1 type-F conjugative transfer system pilin assembly protein TrbC [Legionella pneumophila]HAU0359516.1 type-F conjugative transfer system pilin assembly protein TrbC [Legionella pneumophila]HAU0368073.1 type-F conjugative transfer system pilin assembly protein TrbC [Legionella pneumophila]
MHVLRVILAGFLFHASSYANMNDLINQAGKSAEQQSGFLNQDVIHAMRQTSQNNSLQQQTLIDQILKSTKSNTPGLQKGQYVDGAVLFVSFSMPEPLLFALADEAAAYKIPVVINGLIDGDFKKTISKFSELHAHAKKEQFRFQGVSIDPIWFEQFQISAVPALVVSKRPDICGQQLLCKEQTFDVVYGNSSVQKSLELIASKGNAAPDVAKNILETGHV